jgi:hypothetical protein
MRLGKITSKENVMEIELTRDNGTVLGKDFIINPAKNGIVLLSFTHEGQKFTVKKVVRYEPWNFGFVNPGAGQMGVYEVEEEKSGEVFLAIVKDYRAFEGDWRVILMDIRKK